MFNFQTLPRKNLCASDDIHNILLWHPLTEDIRVEINGEQSREEEETKPSRKYVSENFGDDLPLALSHAHILKEHMNEGLTQVQLIVYEDLHATSRPRNHSSLSQAKTIKRKDLASST